MDGTVRGRRWGWGPRWGAFRYESRSSWPEDGVLPPVLNREEKKTSYSHANQDVLGIFYDAFHFLQYLKSIVGVSPPAFFMLHFRIQLLLILFHDVWEVRPSTAFRMILFTVTVMRLWNADCVRDTKTQSKANAMNHLNHLVCLRLYGQAIFSTAIPACPALSPWGSHPQMLLFCGPDSFPHPLPHLNFESESLGFSSPSKYIKVLSEILIKKSDSYAEVKLWQDI